MPPAKTTKAKYYSARFNPATSEEDAKAVEIIERLQAEGFKFKDIAQDAILRADGYKPEMFSSGDRDTMKLLSQLENMFTRFAEELIQRIGDRPQGTGYTAPDDDEPEQPTSKFARSFAKTFLQRQQNGDSD